MEHISRNEARSRNLQLYFDGEPCKHGHIAPRYVAAGHCLECLSLRLKRRSYTEEDIVEGQRKHEAMLARRAAAGKSVAEHFAAKARAVDPVTSARKRMWEQSKRGARTRGIPFTIKPSDIKIPPMCPVLNIPLRFGAGLHHANSPSLDRIDNSKGYAPGNVMVISYRANCLKRDATFKELVAMGRFYTQFLPGHEEEEG